MPSLETFDKIICGDGSVINLEKSNQQSPIIKFLKETMKIKQYERLFDKLSSNYSLLKLLTNPIIDLNEADINSPIFLYSSSKNEHDLDEAQEAREEYSEKAWYRLDSEIKPIIEQMQPHIQMMASGDIQYSSENLSKLSDSKRLKLIYQINDMYGYSFNNYVTSGFKHRTNLITLSDITWQEYEKCILQLLNIGVGSVFQHMCWCKNHCETPYAKLIFGHNKIGEINCPICTRLLFSSCYITLDPIFHPLLTHYGGFLSVLVGWYCIKNNIEWVADVKIDQKEYGDLLLVIDNKYYLLECKVQSRDKTKRGQLYTHEKNITQALNHLSFWEQMNVEIEKTIILTNEIKTDGYNKEVERALKNKENEINNRVIQILPITLVHDILKNILI